jgi:hypothetical protein
MSVIASQRGRRVAPPDDRLGEAIHLATRGDMDCFRLRSSSYGGQVVASLLAMTLYPGTRSNFCRQRATFTSGGISVSGKLVFQSVTPTSPT